MNIPKKDLKFEYMRGQGKGGQHRNKTDSCVRVTHIPSGISVTIDGRNQHQNKKKALAELEERLKQSINERKADAKKAERDEKIRETKTIRTYDYKSGLVKDHRTGKTASLKEVLKKGNLDLLN
jgi:peptide chain release factor 1